MFPSSDWLVSKSRARNPDWEAAIGVVRVSTSVLCVFISWTNAPFKISSTPKPSSPRKTPPPQRSGPLQKPTAAQKASLRKHPRKSSLSSVTKLPKITEESPPRVHTHKRNKSSLNPTALPFQPNPRHNNNENSYSGRTRSGAKSSPSYPLSEKSTNYMFAEESNHYGRDHGIIGGERANRR